MDEIAVAVRKIALEFAVQLERTDSQQGVYSSRKPTSEEVVADAAVIEKYLRG